MDIKSGPTEQGTILSDDTIFCVIDARMHPLTPQLELHGTTVPFEVNTGAAVTIISQSTRQKFLLHICLRPTRVTQQTYVYCSTNECYREATCQCQLW